MKQTRKQSRAARRIENKRRHRALKGMKVTTYEDLIARDRNPRRSRNPGRFRGFKATVVRGGSMDILGQLQHAWRFGTPAEYEAAKRRYERDVGTIPWAYQEKRRNPMVRFKARGRRVRFYAKPKRRGPVPKHLKKYAFKRRSRRPSRR